MNKDFLPFHPNPAKPSYVPPAGAVDAHCHVFGPAAKFPYAPQRKYTPGDAGAEKLFELRDYLGFSRNVVVQASCHGTNNDALVDALNIAGDLARGVAVVDQDISIEQLEKLHIAGVRAVRFNFVKRLVDIAPPETYLAIAKKIADMGWHIVVYLEAPDLEELIPFIKQLPTIVVIDHMGRPDVSKGIAAPNFMRFVDFLDNNTNIWTKVSCPERLSIKGPPYEDVVPFSKLLVENFTDRTLWGTDWPHPNMKSHMPDDGQLVDMIPKIAPEQKQRQALLVDNPQRLYFDI
ncbi:2-pyrone-4,6-dicarboxylic acid hydrolase [hydrothermal vent metagenome]|uniref:2-pyrone-4,6-dicarboxylic acid hydrolase n=1 Tax=hydrothermal vent metagenome TaxID=652676 RepID=A0A3B0U6C7_9ZZZZ